MMPFAPEKRPFVCFLCVLLQIIRLYFNKLAIHAGQFAVIQTKATRRRVICAGNGP